MAVTGQPTTGLSGPVAFGAGLLLLGIAPIIRGGNRHVALVLLEWVSLLVLFALLVQGLVKVTRSPVGGRWHGRASIAGFWLLALAPLWAALLQLTPLPAGLWAALPGHAPYVEALAVAQIPAAGYRALSLVPDITLVSVLAGMPLSAALLLTYFCSPGQLALLVRALIVLASAQAALGLLQMGPDSGLFFGARVSSRAIGTFANPNHFASYITMTVPLAILVLRQAMASARMHATGRQSRRALGMGWGVALFLMLSAVLASGSRGGTITCLLVTLLAVLFLPLNGNRRIEQRRWRVAGGAALLAVVALTVGVDSLLARFEGGNLAGDRWLYITSTWHAALAFLPFGSGLGSYAFVFPTFHPVGVKGFVEHAHNDYAELLMECGLLTVALAALALALISCQTVALVRRARRSGLDATGLLQASCGLGLLAVLLHSWVDFNLRIPANAIVAAFLLGALLRPLSDGSPGLPGQPASN